MPLIVIESPNKIKKIKALTGAEVIATVGHFKELPGKELGIDLTTYDPTFVANPQKAGLDTTLRTKAQGQDVYIATDPDREGYAIGRFVYEAVKRSAKNIYRLEIFEITEKGIREAMQKAIPYNQTNPHIFDAFLGRRVGDRLVGYILSPDVISALNENFSVGRVQSPALRLIVDRDREIANFKPSLFWNLVIDCEKGNTPFKAKYTAENIKDESQARYVASQILAATSATVTNVETKEAYAAPKAPFTTVTLQQAASSRLGIAPEETMALAQSLFEAGLITYHRTDSVRIADEIVVEIRALVTAQFGADHLPPAPNTYKSKNSQADAHEAIRPAHIHPLDKTHELIQAENLTPTHEALYRLILLRTVASQMTRAVYDATVVTLEIGEYAFLARGRVLRHPGHLALDNTTDDETEDNEATAKLPPLVTGESVKKTGQDVIRGETKPPSRYTEGKLVAKLETLGIGRPSTYASICKTIKDREYVAMQAKFLTATPKGTRLIDYLRDKHPWVIDYDFTKQMESYLDDVEQGKNPWQSFAKQIHGRMGFAKPTSKPAGPRTRDPKDRLGACPFCGAGVYEAPFGYICEKNANREETCKFILFKTHLKKPISKTAAKEILATGRTKKKMKFISSAGKEYEAFLQYNKQEKRLTLAFN